MPPKKYAVGGKPDFHRVSDAQLKSFLNLTQQLVFAYKHHDGEKFRVLEEVWKDLSDEDAERSALSAIKDIERQECEEVSPAPLLKKVPKIRKSPAQRKS